MRSIWVITYPPNTISGTAMAAASKTLPPRALTAELVSSIRLRPCYMAATILSRASTQPTITPAM
ncbi:MAG: hypothetical protein O7B24_04345 [Alphaproteobacteria bacterium]|nr:hypothetical protein [Alphaproteobacteria bacterium]